MNCQHWYFYVQNLSSVCLFIFQSEEDISVEQAQSHHLAQCLRCSFPAGLTFLELYWSAVGFVYYFVGMFICTGGDLWCPVYVICCLLVLYYHSGEFWCPVDVICCNFFIILSRFFLIHDVVVILLYIYPVFVVNRPNRKITVHNRVVMQSRCMIRIMGPVILVLNRPKCKLTH